MNAFCRDPRVGAALFPAFCGEEDLAFLVPLFPPPPTRFLKSELFIVTVATTVGFLSPFLFPLSKGESIRKMDGDGIEKA